VSAEDAITEVAVEITEETVAEAVVPGLGNVTAGFAVVGSSSINSPRFRITGFSLTTDRLRVVQFQPRQNDNQDFNSPDQFAVQVITTARDNIVCRVRRLDADGGWGQNLHLDLFVVDRTNFWRRFLANEPNSFGIHRWRLN
jgi:hypothetical protein